MHGQTDWLKDDLWTDTSWQRENQLHAEADVLSSTSLVSECEVNGLLLLAIL